MCFSILKPLIKMLGVELKMLATAYRCLRFKVSTKLKVDILKWLPYQPDLRTDPLELLTQLQPILNSGQIWIWLPPSSRIEAVAWIQTGPWLVPRSGIRYCSDPKLAQLLADTYSLDRKPKEPQLMAYACMAGSLFAVEHLIARGHKLTESNLYHIAHSGNLRLFTSICRRARLLDRDLMLGSLHQALARGQVGIVDWIHRQFQFKTADFRTSKEQRVWFDSYVRSSEGNTNWSLMEALRLGCLPMIQYLFEEVGLTRADFSPGLISAAASENLQLVQYLHREVGCTLDDFSTERYRILKMPCVNGDLPMLQYLVDGVGLTPQHFRDSAVDLISVGIDCGHIHLLEWMRTELKFTPADLKASEFLTETLRSLFQNRNLEMLRYLHQTWGLTAQDLRNCGSLDLDNQDPGLEMLQYAHTMGLTATDFEQLFEDLGRVVTTNNLVLLQWLHEVVGLDLESERLLGPAGELLEEAITLGNLAVIQYFYRYRPHLFLQFSRDLDTLSTPNNITTIRWLK